MYICDADQLLIAKTSQKLPTSTNLTPYHGIFKRRAKLTTKEGGHVNQVLTQLPESYVHHNMTITLSMKQEIHIFHIQCTSVGI